MTAITNWSIDVRGVEARISSQFRQPSIDRRVSFVCNAAGMPARCSFHGLRKAASRRLAEHGCTPHEIAAITGHVTLKEIERHTKAAERKVMARSAFKKLKTETASG